MSEHRQDQGVTWLYIVVNGASMRVRYDLRLRCEVGRPEAWTEPPSMVNDDASLDGFHKGRGKTRKHERTQ
jgi:hypothetical protein